MWWAAPHIPCLTPSAVGVVAQCGCCGLYAASKFGPPSLHPVRRLVPGPSARDQQFAFTPGASPATYANAVPALRRCARTRPSTALTCASTLSAHPDTSPMLAFAAVSLLSLVTHQATRHGRPGFHPCNSGTPLIAITQRDPSAGHPPVIPLPAASGSSPSVKPRPYYGLGRIEVGIARFPKRDCCSSETPTCS